MNITTCSIYSEPNTFFSISYKITLFIREKLNELIGPNIAAKDLNCKTINLIVSTSKNTFNVKVKGPDTNNKSGFINWGLWLPYNEISMACNQVVPFVKFYFDAVALVFKNYSINEDDVREVQRIVEREVIDNPVYIYKEEDTPAIDLSDLNSGF